MLIHKQIQSRNLKTNLIVFLYLYWIVCSIFFLHIHVLKSGEVIQHKHPYPIAKKGNDHHSENEIRTFSSDYLFEFSEGPVYHNLNPFFILWGILWKFPIDLYEISQPLVRIFPRGPPIFMTYLNMVR